MKTYQFQVREKEKETFNFRSFKILEEYATKLITVHFHEYERC